MRVAIVSDYLPDYVGGAQTSMREQLRVLSSGDHHCVTITAGTGRPEPSELRIRPLVTLPGVRLPVIRNTAALRERLARYLRDERIEVVHVQSEFGLAHAAVDVARRLGLPVVHTVHTFYWTAKDEWHGFLAPVLRRRLQSILNGTLPDQSFTGRPVDDLLRNTTLALARRADAIVSPSAHQAADLAAAGVDAPISVVANPVAPASRPPVPLPDGEPRFLWVARCEVFKRPLEFAEAARLALARGARFSVDFVGDGPLLRRLRAIARTVPAIRVHGELSHERVLGLIDESSLVVLSSLGFDNQPMTVAEAVTRHRGVLYCDPRLSEGLARAGHLAADPSPDALADALVELASRPDRRRELAEGARLEALEFSATHYRERILAVYGEVRRRGAAAG